jgi:hypothetical protein
MRWLLLSGLLALGCQQHALECPKPIPCRPIDLGVCHAPPADLRTSSDMTLCGPCKDDNDCGVPPCSTPGVCDTGRDGGTCVFM